MFFRIGRIRDVVIEIGKSPMLSMGNKREMFWIRIGHIREVVIEIGKTSMLSMRKKEQLFCSPHRSHR